MRVWSSSYAGRQDMLWVKEARSNAEVMRWWTGQLAVTFSEQRKVGCLKRTKTSKDLPSSAAVSGSSLSSSFCRKCYIRRSLQLRENYRHTTKRVWLRQMQGLPAESLIHDCRDSPFLSRMSLSSPLTLAMITSKSFCAVMKDGSFWTGMSWQVSFVSTKSRLYAFVGKKSLSALMKKSCRLISKMPLSNNSTFCYDFIIPWFIWQLFSFYEYARGHYALNGRVTFLRTRLLRIPVSRITCHRLMYSYVSLSISCVLLPVPVWIVDSSPYVSWLRLSPFVSSTRLLMFLAYAFPFVVCRLVSHLVILGLWLVYDSFPFYERLYVYLADCYIYGLEMWACSPSSIYFATTLKVWPARDPTYSPSSSLVHWPRLLLCDS